MRSKEFILKPGETIPDKVREILGSLFSSDALVDCGIKGARVKITISSPWPKPLRKQNLQIDSNLIAHLKTLAHDEATLEREVALLTGAQILQIGHLLGLPMAKKTKLESLRAQLISSLRSEIIWRGIAGTTLFQKPPVMESPQPQEVHEDKEHTH